MSKAVSGRAAYVEDVDHETGEVDPETRKSANSGAKRSNGSLKKEIIATTTALPSDSGVSGLSRDSKGSGESNPAAKPARSSRKADEAAAPVRRRATVSEREPRDRDRAKREDRARDREHDERMRRRESKRDARPRSPEKSTRRSPSRARRPEVLCDDPACRDYHPAATQNHKPRPSPLETATNINYPPFTPTRQPQYSPATSIPQPAYPAGYDRYGDPHGHTVGSRARAISMAGNGRPLSYHEYFPSSSPTAGFYAGASQAYPSNSSHDRYSSRPTYVPVQAPQMAGSPTKAAPVRPTFPRSTHDDSINYSTRISAQSMPQVPIYKPRRQSSRDVDDFEITTRPNRRSYQALPGSFPQSDTSESSPERPDYSRRDSMAMPPPERPPIRHAATTSDAVPRRSGSQRPVLVHDYPSYDRAYDRGYDRGLETRSDQYLSGTNQGKVLYPSGSGRSERSYRTYHTDPVEYGRVERGLPYGASLSRRMSTAVPPNTLQRQQAEIQHYQDEVRGHREEKVTAETLRRINRNSIGAPPSQSAISGGSHRSHRSRHSISSSGGMMIQFNGATVDVPEGHSVSLKQENGRSQLIIEDGRGKEKKYLAERSVRSSAQASSGGHSSRSRAESGPSRGRRNSVRPDHRRSVDHSGDGGYGA